MRPHAHCAFSTLKEPLTLHAAAAHTVDSCLDRQRFVLVLKDRAHAARSMVQVARRRALRQPNRAVRGRTELSRALMHATWQGSRLR